MMKTRKLIVVASVKKKTRKLMVTLLSEDVDDRGRDGSGSARSTDLADVGGSAVAK